MSAREEDLMNTCFLVFHSTGTFHHDSLPSLTSFRYKPTLLTSSPHNPQGLSTVPCICVQLSPASRSLKNLIPSCGACSVLSCLAPNCLAMAPRLNVLCINRLVVWICAFLHVKIARNTASSIVAPTFVNPCPRISTTGQGGNAGAAGGEEAAAVI